MVPSAIQERAAKAWSDKLDAPALTPIRAAWLDSMDEPFPATFADWQAVMADDADGDLRLIAVLRDAASLAAATQRGFPSDAAEAIVALMLHAFEHHVVRHAGADVLLAQLQARLQCIDEPLAAQVMAACLTGQGLLLMASTEGAEPEAESANIIEGLSPEVLQLRDGKAAVRLEVDAALQAMRPAAGKGSLKQRRAASRARQATPRSEAAIKVDLAGFRRKWRTGLIFVVEERSAAAALKDAEVCSYAAGQLGVHVCRYGSASSDTDDAWAEVVADMVEPLREAISVMFPKAELATVAADGRLPQVFLSYAHDDQHQPAFQQVRDTLDALVQNQCIRLWVDKDGIRTGMDFHPDIRAGIDGSRVALVLVSKALLKSRYVIEQELPYIIKRRGQPGFTFCPVLLSDCDRGLVPDLEDANFKFGVGSLESLAAQPAALSAQLAEISRWLRDHLAGRAL